VAQLNNSQVSCRLQVDKIICKHNLLHRVVRGFSDATALFTVMVIITLKTILNEKVDYHFCKVIILFWLRQKVVSYTKYKIETKLWIFLSEALATLEKRQTTPRLKTMTVLNHRRQVIQK